MIVPVLGPARALCAPSSSSPSSAPSTSILRRGVPTSKGSSSSFPRPRSHTMVRVTTPSTPPTPPPQTKKQLTDDIKYLVSELRAVELPSKEIEQYLFHSRRVPQGLDAASMSRAFVSALDAANFGREADADAATLLAVKNDVTTLWKWRRRGGGVRESDEPAHQVALRDLQGFDLVANEEVMEEDPAQIRSALLDNANLSEEQKAKMGRAINGAMYGAVQSFLWNAVVLMVVALGALNMALMSTAK